MQKTVLYISNWVEKVRQVIKINSEMLLNMKLFGDITHVVCVDCFTANGTIFFLTSTGNASKAIGSGGKNIKILRNRLNKNVKVFEKNTDSCELAKNYLYPTQPKKCEQVENTLELEFNSSRKRRYLLDNQQRGLKELKAVIARYHPSIKDIRIL